MAETTSTNYFNKKEVYEQQIKEKVDELLKLCRINGIPAFFSACTVNSEDESLYEQALITPIVTKTKLTDDRFPDYIKLFGPRFHDSFIVVERDMVGKGKMDIETDDFQEAALLTETRSEVQEDMVFEKIPAPDVDMRKFYKK